MKQRVVHLKVTKVTGQDSEFMPIISINIIKLLVNNSFEKFCKFAPMLGFMKTRPPVIEKVIESTIGVDSDNIELDKSEWKFSDDPGTLKEIRGLGYQEYFDKCFFGDITKKMSKAEIAQLELEKVKARSEKTIQENALLLERLEKLEAAISNRQHENTGDDIFENEQTINDNHQALEAAKLEYINLSGKQPDKRWKLPRIEKEIQAIREN